MSDRTPPPSIPGFDAVETIRAGGFAVVYRYRQARTERDVAVKVLNARLTDQGAGERFLTEARLMAKLSTHPHIVTIHLADVTADDRPYLVMEYASGDDLNVRVKRETLSVPEVLRIGVQIAGAVETAHRAEILHRDIKPANILTTDYGTPALTDFGISSAVQDATDLAGLSVPWSPPEAISDPTRTSVSSDVYSLAATLWHLLAGHSPFSVPGGANRMPDLVHRIRNTPVPRTGRPDVPPGLERLLAVAMAKSPADRPSSMLAFARSLQGAEAAAGYAETTILVRDANHPAATPVVPDDDEPGTRIRGLVTVDPEGAAPPPGRQLIREVPRGGATTAVPEPADEVGRTWARVAPAPPVEDTQIRLRPPVEEAPEPATPTKGRRWWWAGAAAVVVAGGVTAAVLTSAGAAPSTNPQQSPASDSGSGPAVGTLIPAPTDLSGSRRPDGVIVFQWNSPGAAKGDEWVVTRTDPGANRTSHLVETTALEVTGVPAGKQACLDVSLRRPDGHTSAPVSGCAG